ncbi:DUF4097 family beta strand repeat-containing protein [Streptomyces celluloflavus]|uniref:DUF4097 family beta strand repeat-containing protein n=1 Tax=Streptomyces celluloflavus TaxID=58344 RepID=A0ABW7R5E9_9ACTN
MSDRTEWSISAPQKLEFEAPVTALNVRVIGGTVNVVGTSDGGPPRLEISELTGPPLLVSCRDGVLSIGYEDVTWPGILGQFDPKEWGRGLFDPKAWRHGLKGWNPTGWHRSAVISVTVPAATRVEVGAATASAVISGISGRTELRGVSGDGTLAGLTGPVRADTVSGRIEAQAVTGELRFHSVSGDLTVIEGAGGSVRADSVSGDMVLDLDLPPAAPDGTAAARTDISLTTVSGEVAIRLPDPADTRVTANTTSGTVSNAFDDLRVSGQWGAKRITGSLGAGTGTLKVTTVSGGLALLRRPATEEPHGAPGGGADGAAPTGTPTEKKVR